MSPADGSDPETLADQSMRAALRRDMLRFARLQLRDAGLAEDAVQKAIAGAPENAHRYAWQAAFKTWLFGILFNASGHWNAQTKPKAWGDPEDALSNKQFWLVFEACLDHLPANVARIFMMREMLGLETTEICAELGITPNNCQVTLHRARAGLRACLEGHWFTPGERPSC